jgi:hypothetical protein
MEMVGNREGVVGDKPQYSGGDTNLNYKNVGMKKIFCSSLIYKNSNLNTHG